MSYERTGWLEGEPARVTGRLEIRPAAELGPIIVCLDTSGSMSGARETVAKVRINPKPEPSWVPSSCAWTPTRPCPARARPWPRCSPFPQHAFHPKRPCAGPIIVCLDTSGSMSGARDTVAMVQP